MGELLRRTYRFVPGRTRADVVKRAAEEFKERFEQTPNILLATGADLLVLDSEVEDDGGDPGHLHVDGLELLLVQRDEMAMGEFALVHDDDIDRDTPRPFPEEDSEMPARVREEQKERRKFDPEGQADVVRIRTALESPRATRALETVQDTLNQRVPRDALKLLADIEAWGQRPDEERDGADAIALAQRCLDLAKAATEYFENPSAPKRSRGARPRVEPLRRILLYTILRGKPLPRALRTHAKLDIPPPDPPWTREEVEGLAMAMPGYERANPEDGIRKEAKRLDTPDLALGILAMLQGADAARRLLEDLLTLLPRDAERN